jgi:RNA polymerase sigma-70 factor, ECF subfamily
VRTDDVTRNVLAIRQLASALVSDQSEAADVSQEACLALLRHPPRQQPVPSAWIGRVIGNFVRLRAREEHRRERRHAASALLGPERTPTPDVLVERAELRAEVADMILELREPFRKTLVLRYYGGMAAPEIGRLLGVSEGTVRWRIKIGLDRLRAVVGDQERLD